MFITKEHLILNYFLIRKKTYLKWDSITDAGMQIIQSTGSDSRHITGKEIRLFANEKNYFISLSKNDSNSDKLMIELKKRLDSKLKSKMKNELVKSEKTFLKSEKEYQKEVWKIIIPILIILLLIVMFWK